MPISEVESTAPARTVWCLIAQPRRWREWSPYVTGGEGLGTPEVQAGARGRVVLLGGVRLPAHVLEVDPGRAWSWQVGGLRITHAVEERAGGSLIRHELAGSGLGWSALGVAYLPPVALIARNVARVAERDARETG